jgi:penicillin amidase
MRRRSLRLTYWTLGLVPGLATVVLGAGLVWLRGSLPDLEGNHALPALTAPVEVLRDVDGIVTIRAAEELDAARALGYVHAQDRLWQMDFMRRTGAGRLSEVVGPATLGFDRLMRGLGLYRLAEAGLSHLAPETRALLEAYAEGVNAFIAAPGGPWPPEFHLLRYRPEPWRPADSLVWGRLMAFQLSSNWPDEVRRLRLAGHLTPEQIEALWPSYPPDAPVTLGRRDISRRAAKPALPARASETTLRARPVWDPDEPLPWSWAPKTASNVWVLAGARTASGRPILANDPHLPLKAPGLWYLVRIETPELTLAGATAPGVPFLVAGHNGRIAWGFTTTHADTQDLFVEQLSKDEPGHYDTPHGPRPFVLREEVIEVRGHAPETLTVRATRHGPVLSDLRPRLASALPEGQVLALAWPALREDDRTAEALHRLNRARDWPGFLAAMEHFDSPVQNVAYADTSGTIGFIAAGRVPRRSAGDGRSPVPGWSGDYDWQGFVPFAELPMTKNPPEGRIVNANNRVVDEAYPHLIAVDWPGSHRARRIEELLAARDETTLDDSLTLQQDAVSLAARGLLPVLLQAPPGPGRAAEARALLARWDHRMAPDRAEPLIFYAWLAALNEAVFADELGAAFPSFARIQADLLLEVLVERPEWCDDIATEDRETCGERIALALTMALDDLEERYGSDIHEWRWGDAHATRFPHPILRHVPLAERFFGFAVEAGGGSYTVNRGGVPLSGPSEHRFTNVHGPGFRAVYDLADLDQSHFMIATGQSGNPLSQHYGSLVPRWRDGDYLKLDGAATAPRYRLRLDPG